MNQELTQEYLKSVLHYNPDTGVFTRLKNKTRTDTIGKIKGYLRKDGYLRIRCENKKQYLAHHLAYIYMTGIIPKHLTNEIDHINHIRHDNRWCNLQMVDRSVNMINKSLYGSNKTGHVGVCWDKKSNKWRAYIRVNSKTNLLGVIH